MFAKIVIYKKGNDFRFSDILESKKPEVLINIDNISSIGEKRNFGYCNGKSTYDYPFRELVMKNGDRFWCVIESIRELEDKLLAMNQIII